jgi:hypothetical protein
MVSVLLDAVSETPLRRMNEPLPLLSESAVKLIGALTVRLWLSEMLLSAV